MKSFSIVPVLTAAAAGLGALFVSSAALAQEDVRVDHDFSVQRFQAAPGPRNFITMRGARVDGEKVWGVGFLGNFGLQPLIVRACSGQTCDTKSAVYSDKKVVETMITSDFLGSFTIMPRVQLGLRVPVMYVHGVGITSQGNDETEGVKAVGISDPELEGKFRVYGDPKAPVVIGATVFATAPVGNAMAKDKFLGDAHPTAGARVIFDGEQKGFSFGANLGGAYRKSVVIGGTNLGSELRYAAAVGYKPSPVIRVLGEVFGTSRFTTAAGENTLEGNVAAQIFPLGSAFQIMLGGGTGLVQGVGVPKLRVFAGLYYAAEGTDADKDGIEGAADQCPTEPEDRDGYEDSDGCPDNDNDLDTIPDAKDKCPSEAEDQDGFEDSDGCPEADNDKDGIPDTGDRCPNEPESKNGFKDEDGCPDEADTDNDGVPDARDKCVNEPEDTDGYEDTDGCPDPDNDGDGILDADDECVDEAETKNGFEDEDGCPDEKTGKGGKKK
ncbi:MAG TPA: thrombospondin type 3 repeat-containing protein [Polyangiaceae bacterium]|nr:thrombospondin type 3 repeat-containing protein [Polyangiaceae bacterium]